MTKFMAGLVAGVMLAAAAVSFSQGKAVAKVDVVPVVTSGTLRVQCLSNGDISFKFDPKP